MFNDWRWWVQNLNKEIARLQVAGWDRLDDDQRLATEEHYFSALILDRLP
jgi:hypothetical protein